MSLAPDELQDETITIGRALADLSPDALINTVFAQKYELIDRLGKGGMSVVYRARHKVLDKIVALKILHVHLANDALSLRRFKQEAQAAGTLDHPNIVAVHDCGESEDGTPYLVMDLIQGRSLSEELRSQGNLKLERFLLLMRQVSSALEHAHKAGIVHRDLKPSNIMIAVTDSGETAKIVDFGIAKMISSSSEGAQQLTQTGEVFGSPFYMSPEQCGGASVDHRADIYSLGCVMYEALSGSPPHKGESVVETIHKHMNDSPPPLQAAQLSDEAKQKLEVILLRCLAKQPEDRYQSMSELNKDLNAIGAKSTAGILTSIGDAWDLASAKRRAKRKNRLPLMVVTLMTISSLSAASLLCMLGGLSKAGSEISRLEQSRKMISEVSLAQVDFDNVSEAGRNYFTMIFLSGGSAGDEADNFNISIRAIEPRMKSLDKALDADPKMQEQFRNRWYPKLHNLSTKAKKVFDNMDRNALGGAAISPGNITSSLALSKICSDGATTLREMSKAASKIEKQQMGDFKITERWVTVLGIISAALSSVVVVSLLVYFGKGTPQRLKELAANASKISQKRGLGATEEGSKDDVADLDNVLQQLATALTEAEEREQILLSKLKTKEVQESPHGVAPTS
ncbi:MAG: serine/threonine protein kinase [Candidatus Obscuribacterales bacterium]|nr:serine/threonine protein kinase [Candidatus Obscuribacterales bacterium]